MASFVSILFLWFSARTYAALHVKTTEDQVNLLELFSSEGCSNCASSEKWLTALRGRSGLWKTFVPVEFHIDAKNLLGWTDPFTQKQLPLRKLAYAQEWGVTSNFFPLLVLNGAEWNQRRPISEIQEKKGTKVGVLSVDEIGDYEFELNFRAVSRAPQWIAFAALLGNGLADKGKNQPHDFVALQISSQMMEKRHDMFWALLQLSRYDLTTVKSLSVAFWVSQINEMRPEQAIGTDLPKNTATTSRR
jgi:hypothetical protein